MRIGLTLAVLGWAAGGVWAQDGAADELGKAGSRAQEWKSYAFKITTTTEGLPNRGGPGLGATEGEFVADKGLHVSTGQMEFIRKGDKTAIKGRDGGWSAPRQGGGQGGRGGGFFTRMTAPHESFKDIQKCFKTVDKTQEGDLTVFSGELTPEGATKLSGRGSFGRGGAGNTQASGTAKVYVDTDGNIVRVQVSTQVKMNFRNQETEIKTERTIEISKIGSADFEVPDDARKVLGD